MFKVCNYLFNMEIPKELKDNNNDDVVINVVVDDIFTGGVYGQRDLSYC